MDQGMRSAREYLITGHVQGVGFRWTAKKLAGELGLDGWVRNNPDGSVSLVAEGTDKDIHRLINRLDSTFGSRIAAVTGRDVKPGKNRDGFDVVH